MCVLVNRKQIVINVRIGERVILVSVESSKNLKYKCTWKVFSCLMLCVCARICVFILLLRQPWPVPKSRFHLFFISHSCLGSTPSDPSACFLCSYPSTTNSLIKYFFCRLRFLQSFRLPNPLYSVHFNKFHNIRV